MKNNVKFKLAFEDFITERIEESYEIVSKKKSYKKLNINYKKMEKVFLKTLENEALKESYYNFRDVKLNLDTLELQEAYLLGFKDCIKIQNY